MYNMSFEDAPLLTQFAQHLKFGKKFDAVKFEQQRRRQTKFDVIPPLKTTRSSRFYQLNPRFWQKRMSIKPKFHYLRDIALENFRTVLTKKLSIFYDTHSCDETLYSGEEVPNRLYSWDLGDFMKRRTLDTVWLDVIKKQLSKECFSELKFQSDIREIRRYLRLIFNVFVGANKTTAEDKIKLFAYLRESVEAATVGDKIKEELNQNNAALTALSVVYLKLNTRLSVDRKSTQYRLYLEGTWMDSITTYPLDMRYQVSCAEDRVKQSQERSFNAEDKYEQEIKQYIKQMEYEKSCSNYALQLYNSEIEEYKKRILSLSSQYENEYEEIDSKITLKKIALDKLKERRKFLMEQLLRFREELENLRLAEAKHNSELQRKRLVELETEAQLLKKKGRKKSAAKKPTRTQKQAVAPTKSK